MEDVKALQPTLFVGVPRLFTKIYDKVSCFAGLGPRLVEDGIMHPSLTHCTPSVLLSKIMMIPFVTVAVCVVPTQNVSCYVLYRVLLVLCRCKLACRGPLSSVRLSTLDSGGRASQLIGSLHVHIRRCIHVRIPQW